MSYEKHEWQCGETVTADKMNNLEDGIEEALACCGGGGGDSDCGYACYQAGETVFSETVSNFETEDDYIYVGELSYNKYLDLKDSPTVIFDGVEYEDIDYEIDEYSIYMGDWYFSDYPFVLECNGGLWELYVLSNQPHTIELRIYEDANDDTIATTRCFEDAVKKQIPCFETVTFRNTSSVSIPANSFNSINVTNTIYAGEIYAGAIADFYLNNDGLSCFGIQALTDSNDMIESYDIFVRNNTADAINVDNVWLTIFGMVICDNHEVQ